MHRELAAKQQGRVIDITGQRFGRLLVVSYHGSRKRHAFWLCRCDCGMSKVVNGKAMRAGDIVSCGCYDRERRRRPKVPGHKAKESITYTSWRAMRERCANPNAGNYDDYGGRGVKCCDRWAHFTNFLADMGERPSRLHSIERKDNDGDYEPDNCVWATRVVQNRNSSHCVNITHRGQTLCVAEWSKLLRIPAPTIYSRVDRGLPVEKVLAKPTRPRRPRLIRCGGESHTLAEWSRRTGIGVTTLGRRLKAGWTPEEAIGEPLDSRFSHARGAM